MFSLSTSWNSTRHKNGLDLIKEIRKMGFDTVELSFALTEAIVKDILELKKDLKIKVSSLHNICPLPEEIEPDEASPDYYSLASPDDEERLLAIGAAKNTISYAKRFGARAVVLHAGRVQIKDRTKELASLFGNKKDFDAVRAGMIKERRDKKDNYLNNVIKSLKELVPFANETGVALAVENRYYYREIPLADELGEIFENFEPGSLWYWHDVGHAEVFQRLGLAEHKAILNRFQDRLIGLHLHDIIGSINDHKAPGTGTLDFNIVKPYIKKDTIKVIEVHQPAGADEIRRSVEYLTKIFG